MRAHPTPCHPLRVTTVLALLLLIFVSAWRTAASPSDVGSVREPAVAGLFYPADPKELSTQIDNLLAQAAGGALPQVRALVCPHAGYPYSGPVAATAYHAIQGSTYRRVILLAPSHYALFEGASVCAATTYRTPLGNVTLDPVSREIAAVPPFAPEKPCPVQRPGWCNQSSRLAPPSGADTPETWEHSGEVHVPFLQKTLGSFHLVSILVGRADPQTIADALAPWVDDETLVVASSDLSHYHPYDEASGLDRHCVNAVCALDFDAIHGAEACGSIPIQVVMRLAQARGWTPQLLDYRNSGDTAGDKSRVVGYAAIAFTGPDPAQITGKTEVYTAADRKLLLELARKHLLAAAAGEQPPGIDLAPLPKAFSETRACFVTLTIAGELRGCIGHIVAVEPLGRAVATNARAAAIDDPRFHKVRPDEVEKINIEISVLTNPEPLRFSSPEDLPAKLRPGIDGVILNIQGRTATFLPQVWEKLPGKEQFLAALCNKAGLSADAWRSPETEVRTYQVEAFHEPER